jgi:HEAT repeats
MPRYARLSECTPTFDWRLIKKYCPATQDGAVMEIRPIHRSGQKLFQRRMLIISAVLFATSLCAASQAHFRVEWKQQRLSLTAEDVPVWEVLSEVARKTGVEVQGARALRQSANLRFTNLPLRDAFEKILAGVSFAFVESPTATGSVSHLTVMVLGETAGLGSDTARKKAKPSPPANSMAKLERLYNLAKQGTWDEVWKAASQGDPVIQSVALGLLAGHDPDQATALAVTAAHSSDQSHRLVGIQTLAGLDSPIAAQTLGENLSDPDTGVRESAVVSLMGQSSSDSVAALSRALQDRDYSIRMMALDFLAQRGEEGAASLYLASQHNADPQVRSRAHELLDAMPGPE